MEEEEREGKRRREEKEGKWGSVLRCRAVCTHPPFT